MRFKIYFSFICMALMVLPLQAKKVEADQAEMLAQRFMQSKHQLRSGVTLSLKYTATNKKSMLRSTPTAGVAQTSVQDTVYYYVFDVNEATHGGFVIVAGDDVVKPILGYSEKGSYDENNLPPNFAWWMDGIQKQIAYAQSHNLPQSETVKNEWNSYLNGTVAASASVVGPLIQTQWDQGFPYNNLCPTIGGTPVPTGCVATAMAQIMKYWNYPASGSGKGGAYTTQSGIDISPVSFEVNYDWANMQNTYDGSETPQQQNAVATLMYQCGLSVQMQYDPNESGSDPDIRYALINNFGYDRNMQFINRNPTNGSPYPIYNTTDWENMLRVQIDDGLPICYKGGDHVFVCDGYDDSGKFHFNWGWGGWCDGYFLTSALNLDSYDFNYQQIIITDIKPCQGGLSGLNVSAGTLSPTFRPYVFDYTLNVDASVSSIDITGISGISDAVITGNVTGLSLKLNDFTDVTIQVKLPNGNIQNYKISIIRGNIPDPSFTWKIDNAGKTVSVFIAVLPGDSLYVDWGDGTKKDMITVNASWKLIGGAKSFGNEISHTYDSAGIYEVTIYGENKLTCPLLNLCLNNIQGDVSYFDNIPINQFDIRKAPQLISLSVNQGKIINLDVSHNPMLRVLSCSQNQLSKLDVSNNMALTLLSCDDNQLTNLDISQTPKLYLLNCQSNQFKDLDVSHNPELYGLYCSFNQIENLDVSTNAALVNLICGNNQLTKFDISKNTLLNSFLCDNNQLTNLDVSHNPALIYLHCANNQLTNMDMNYNPELLDLDCSLNQLKNLDLSDNTALESLNCSYNQIIDLDVSHSTSLVNFYCNNNQLTKLDVSNNTKLPTLDCSNNQLEKLDVSYNTALQALFCNNNQLTNLNVSSNPALTDLQCQSNAIPLINLYTLAQQAGNITTKNLGQQTLPDSTIFVSTSIAIDTVFYGVNTTCNYPLDNGKITFSEPGDYQVTISNPALLDGSVQQTFHVVQQGAGINNVPQTKFLEAWMQNEILHVSGLTAGKSWSVFNASGKLIYQSIANSEQADIPLFASGVYLIQSGNKTVKVIKK